MCYEVRTWYINFVMVLVKEENDFVMVLVIIQGYVEMNTKQKVTKKALFHEAK